MFPLDTVKTQLQAFKSPNINFKSTVLNIIKERGFSGFLRGWSAIATGCIPAHIALFSVYEESKSRLSDQNGELSSINAAVCGATATLAHDIIITPMDVIKQRLQLGCYNGVTDALRNLTRTEGVQGFFRSLPTALAINAPYGAVFVAINERLKSDTHECFSLFRHFLTAGISGSIACVVTHPLDVVKTRLQTQDILCSGNSFCKARSRSFPVKYPSFCLAVKTILSEEGLTGFYRGLLPRTLLSIPATAICWGTYEAAKSMV